MRRNTRLALVATTAAAALTVSACGGGFDQKSSAQQNTGGKAKLTILIGSSGDAETSAVKDAAKKWSDKSGNTAEVVVASDLAQQLGQGFAGGTPPDVFYADAAASATSPRPATSTPTATRSRTRASWTAWPRPSRTTASSSARRRTTRRWPS